MNEELRRLKESIRQFDEANLARVWQMAEDPSYVFAIMSAFRKGNTIKVNKSRNFHLAKDIEEADLGYWELTGYYIETDEETQEKNKVVEESFFISLPTGSQNSDQRLQTFVINALKKYDQQAAVIKLQDGNIYLIDLTGDLSSIGKFSPGKIADCYSRLNNGRTFVFESTVGHGWARTLANKRIAKLEKEES